MMTAIEDARAAAENCWPMDMDGLPGNQSRQERELLRRGFELGYRVAVERLTAPPTDDEREALAQVLRSATDDGADRTEEYTDAILASDVWRFCRQGPITDAQGRDAFLAFMGMDAASFAEMSPTYRAASIAQGRAALEAARDAS